MFRVDPKTVTRWAQAGKLTSTRGVGALLHRDPFSTPGGSARTWPP
jgi:hypothetical protein